MTIVAIIAVFLVVGGLTLTFVTVSLNARAGRQDTVISVPRAGDDSAAAADFMRALEGATSRPTIGANAMRVFQNGDEIFPPMLEAIAGAKSSVHFATYVYEAGHIPTVFAAAFSDAARRGVEVRVVLDRDGAKKIPPALIEQMRSAGCDVEWFGRAQWYDWEKYNRRSHRKLLVIDGRIGFTGGVGIADQWSGAGDSPEHWRDTHARIDGPAVAALQAVFTDSWAGTTGKLVIGGEYFPPLLPAGGIPIATVQSNPANASSAAQRSVAALIASASRTLYVTNAYFIPEPPFIRALGEASARGVAVKILMPGPYLNKPIVRLASRRTWPELLDRGIELFEHQRTMVHAKVIVVDDIVLCVGSINFDPRSFALNAECAVIAFDRALAEQASRQFMTDVGNARQVTHADLARLSIVERAGDSLAHFFRAQL